MNTARRVAPVGLVALVALAVGYLAVRALDDPHRAPVSVIDLDNLPLVEQPPPPAPSRGGAEVVPPPTVAHQPPAAPISPPPPALGDDDDVVDDDLGEPDDD